MVAKFFELQIYEKSLNNSVAIMKLYYVRKRKDVLKWYTWEFISPLYDARMVTIYTKYLRRKKISKQNRVLISMIITINCDINNVSIYGSFDVTSRIKLKIIPIGLPDVRNTITKNDNKKIWNTDRL